jgi:hypothetical protein
MISPICVFPKPGTNKFRMIFNLSEPHGVSVNANVPDSAKSVEYCSVDDVAKWLLKHDPHREMYMAKADLTDAYRMVPVKKDEWKFLGMRVGNDIYIDRCLPMGASSSCQIFQRISDALAWMARATCHSDCHIFNYLDDFLFLAAGEDGCNRALDHFVRMCGQLKVPISTKKTVRASRAMVFLGLGIDSGIQHLYIPVEKAAKTLAHLEGFLATQKPRVLLWQQVLGKLCHLAQVVAAGKPFLSSVYGSLKGFLSQDQHRRRNISREARGDLEVWVKFLKGLTPEKSFRILDVVLEDFAISTDASSTVGFGCVFQASWFAGSWPNEQWRNCSIAVLELYPIYVALHMWADRFSDSTVAVITDNHALVAVLNRLYCRDKTLRQLLKPISLLCLERNIRVVARHVPGVDNVGPDLLSRGRLQKFHYAFPMMDAAPCPIPVHLTPLSFFPVL